MTKATEVSEQHMEYHRKDDSLLRKVLVGVFILMVGQGGTTIYFAGQLTNQVSNNTKAIAKFAENQESQQTLAIQLAEINVTVKNLSDNVDKASIKLDAVSINQALFSNKLSEVAEEQKRRTELVYGSKKHQ